MTQSLFRRVFSSGWYWTPHSLWLDTVYTSKPL